MNNELKQYINAISVITYDYETYMQVGIPEYYTKSQQDNKNTDILNYTAYGWLQGSNEYVKSKFVISQDNYTTISALNIESYMFPLPYLYQQDDSGKLKNTCNLIFTTQTNSNISGYLTGDITLISKQSLTVSGIMHGYVIDNIINNKIYIQSKVRGNVKSIQTTELITGNVALITSLSGNVYTTDLTTIPSTIIKDISMTNMLGRKALSNSNALFGKNLNIIPADYLDANTGQKKEKWKLLDVTNTLNTTIITGSVQNLLIHTHEQILNTGKIVDNKLVNYPAYLHEQPKHAYKLSVDSQLIYYAIQRGNTKIQLRDNDTLGQNQKLLFGPISTYQTAIHILTQFCNINNIQIYIPQIDQKIVQFDIII